MKLVALICLWSSVPAFAEDKKSVSAVIEKMTRHELDGLHKPAFAFGEYEVRSPPDSASFGDPMTVGGRLGTPTIGIAADGKSGWYAASLGQVVICGEGDCAKVQREADKHPAYHATVLIDGGQPIMFHLGANLTDKKLAEAVKRGAAPGEVAANVAADAKPAVDLAQKTLGDPKAFAATVSDRADVVLLGSDAPEIYVGGAKVRSTLQAWGIAFKVRDGISAGVTASKTVAWVAANVDATAKGAKTATPYRVTLIYEKQGADWKLVAAQFSFAS